MFFLLYKRTETAFSMIFRRFSTTFRRFPKIFQNCPEDPVERFRTFSENFREFPKMSKNFRRLSRKTRRCFDDTQTNLSTTDLRDKPHVTEIIDIFTCEDIVSFLWMLLEQHPLCHPMCKVTKESSGANKIMRNAIDFTSITFRWTSSSSRQSVFSKTLDGSKRSPSSLKWRSGADECFIRSKLEG